MDAKNKMAMIVAAVIVLVAGLGQYGWYAGRAAKINSQVKSLEKQSDDIRQKINDAVNFQKELARRRALYAAFPAKEDAGLRKLFDRAKARGIEVVTVEPGQKGTFKDKEGSVISHDAKNCYFLPVGLKLKASYSQLLDLLKDIDSGLSGFVSVDKLAIRGGGPGYLDVDITVSLYALY